MKKIITPLFIVSLMILITGCPIGIDYALGTPGTEKIDKDLLGSWSQPNAEMEILKVELTKIDNYSVKVVVLERGSMYGEEVDVFTGWFTEVDGKKFIYLKDPNDPDAQYYTYCYDVKGDIMNSYDISLKVAGVDGVTSTETYRQEVSASLKLPEALSSQATWTKQ